MKLSWKWIFEIYGISPTSKEWAIVEGIRTRLPLAGIEIAKVEKLGESLGDILIAKVEETSKHPQADRLNVCKVNNGKEILQIVWSSQCESRLNRCSCARGCQAS